MSMFMLKPEVFTFELYQIWFPSTKRISYSSNLVWHVMACYIKNDRSLLWKEDVYATVIVLAMPLSYVLVWKNLGYLYFIDDFDRLGIRRNLSGKMPQKKIIRDVCVLCIISKNFSMLFTTSSGCCHCGLEKKPKTFTSMFCWFSILTYAHDLGH